MKLEFLDDISAGGKYKGVYTNQLVRLFDFEQTQAEKFRQEIRRTIIENGESLDLSKLEFIEKCNCNLTLHLSKIDKGITTDDNANFRCDLTLNGYENMINLLEPFCFGDISGYQWLYDMDTPIEFLFSTGGSW